MTQIASTSLTLIPRALVINPKKGKAATNLLSVLATLQKAVPPIPELWVVILCLHLVWQCGQIIMLDWPFEPLSDITSIACQKTTLGQLLCLHVLVKPYQA